MKIYVNNQELSFTLENEKTCGDILNQLEFEFEKNNGTIFNIEVNGHTVKAEEIDAISQKTIEEIETIKVISIFAQDIIENLKLLLPRIEEINKNFEELPVFLQGQNQVKVPQILTEFADIFDNLCHLISLTALFPNYFEKITIDGNNLTEFIKEFSPFLIGFEISIKDNDTVTICDIAEYEIKPRFLSLANTLKDL